MFVVVVIVAVVSATFGVGGAVVIYIKPSLSFVYLSFLPIFIFALFYCFLSVLCFSSSSVLRRVIHHRLMRIV